MIPSARTIFFTLGPVMFFLLARGESRADLFAVGTSAGELHRINPDTGNILNTYPIPTGFPIASARSGLAFDGRILYLARDAPAEPFNEIMRFDVVDEAWLEPLLGDPFFPDFIDSFAGLGYYRERSRKSLIGVAWNQAPPDFPLHVVEIPLFGPPFYFSNPIGFFDPDKEGLALDVDPRTDELWMATHSVSTNSQSLIQFDLLGNVLSEIPLSAADFPLPIRGLAFDGGRMFLADVTQNIYEVDRTDASVIRSFNLPVTGLIGSLTGGPVAPEPSSATIAIATGAIAMLAGRNRSRL